MREEIANVVYPVLSYGLRLKERLERGEALQLHSEQFRLRELLLSQDEARRWSVYSSAGALEQSSLGGSRVRGHTSDAAQMLARTFVGTRYALACWLDEIFINDSSWSSQWNEAKLETELYGTNERAWAFWAQAELAESQQGNDALETFFLCVMLGFRGKFRNQPAEVQTRISDIHGRITRGQGEKFELPPEIQPDKKSWPLHGRDRLRRLLLTWGAAAVVMAGVVMFLLIK